MVMEQLKSLVLTVNSRSAEISIQGCVRPKFFGAVFCPFAIVFALMSGCSFTDPADPISVVESRLNGRGPVYVSPDNPFLAANQFLKSESERSFILAGLLKLRGNPQRLEYTHNLWENPRLVLYYDKSRDTLEATKVNDTWIVEQPGAAAVPTVAKSEAMNATPSKGDVRNDRKVEPVNFNPVENPPNSTAKSSPVGFRSEQQAPPKGPALSAVVTVCRSLEALPSAERSPGGDLIHYIVDDRETVSLIAEWYTGETAPAEALLRLNKLSPKQPLTVGDQIVIPKYLVKNGLQLGSRALRCVLTEKAVNS